MFKCLCAFSITPINETSIDQKALANLIRNLGDAKVDSIGVLVSTGSYAYLSREERNLITSLALLDGQH